jgi:hypothetical protein
MPIQSDLLVIDRSPKQLRTLPILARFQPPLVPMDAAQHPPQGRGIFGGVGIVVVIEIDPGSLRAARFDPLRPYCEFVF